MAKAMSGKDLQVTAPVKLLRVEEFAQSLALSPKTVWNWIASRRIAVHRVGRAVRIPDSEVSRILEEGYTPVAKSRRPQNHPHSTGVAA